MTGANGPLRIKEMTPTAIRDAAAADPRLIVPVGTCEQHGAHLPVGSDTIVVERLADDLSASLHVLRAPTIEFGVNDSMSRIMPGGASVRRKTLRRWINDLLGDWEKLELEEILILTMNGFAPHTEALGTVVARRAKIRVLDVLGGMDLGNLIEHPDDPVHGGELDTSLVMYIRPDLVNIGAAADYILPDSYLRRYRRGSAMVVPGALSGSVGRPSSASAEKGRRIYDFMLSQVLSLMARANVATEAG